MPGRQYSDQEKALALAALDANGGDESKTARQTGIPRKTLAYWARGHTGPAVAMLRQGKREDLAERTEGILHQLLDAVPGKIGEASLRDLAVMYGVGVEKMRLLREQPTSRTAVDFAGDEEREACLARLLERRGEGGSRPHPLPPVTLQ